MTRRVRRLSALILAVAAGCGGDESPRDTETPPDSTAAPAPGPDTPTGPDTAADTTAVDSTFAAIRAAACDTIDNSFDCARAIEARRLPGADRVWRAGDTLVLRLRGGDTLRLVDRASGDPAVREYHSFQERWADRGMFLIQKQYYEGSEYLLVDDGTGSVTRLPNWPIRAPDGDRFAVLSLDLVAGYGPNTLQVWTFDRGTPTREWETEPSQWGPREGHWASADTLRFTQHGYCDQLGGEGRGMCDRPAALFNEGGTWHLSEGDHGR
jgi:hypothetical protein